MPRTPLTFPMTAAPTSPTTHPGVQVILDPNGFRMELEAIEENFTIRGGLGTYDGGVISDQNRSSGCARSPPAPYSAPPTGTARS